MIAITSECWSLQALKYYMSYLRMQRILAVLSQVRTYFNFLCNFKKKKGNDIQKFVSHKHMMSIASLDCDHAVNFKL